MIKINLNKAKEIVHSSRRVEREKEFEPYDAIIMKQIPGNDAAEAEKSRAEIRVKYNKIQEDIDACSDADDLKVILESLNNN
jgi:hypothetical protein